MAETTVEQMARNILAVLDDTPSPLLAVGASWYTNCAKAMGNKGGFTVRAGLISLPNGFMLWGKSLPLVAEAVEFGSMYGQHPEILLAARRILDGENPASVIQQRGKRDFFYCITGEEEDRVPLDRHSKAVCLGRKINAENPGVVPSYRCFEEAYRVAHSRIGDKLLDTPAKLMACVRHSTYRNGYNRPGVVRL